MGRVCYHAAVPASLPPNHTNTTNPQTTQRTSISTQSSANNMAFIAQQSLGGWWPPVERKHSHNLYHMFQNGVHEPLQLGLEEAFFLVFDLQTLTVFMCEDTNNLKEQLPVLLSYHALINALDLQTQILAMKRPLTKEECFALFSFAKPTFMASYLVYSHFKKQGWTIKTGLKYGADFVLYHDSPFLSHAEWAVKIINQKKEALSCTLNENSLNNIQRIIKHVAKVFSLHTTSWYPLGCFLTSFITTTWIPELCLSYLLIKYNHTLITSSEEPAGSSTGILLWSLLVDASLI
ncbi:tRNA-splicing endonuclease subunit Sen2 [Balamuthia mandrillaris]